MLQGRISHDAQPAALADADVVVVPSLWVETGPLTVLEAFTAGLPVVGSDISGINEWVTDGSNGLLFPLGDAPALAACLERLCREPQLLDQLRHFPQMASLQEHAREVAGLYRRLVPAEVPCA